MSDLVFQDAELRRLRDEAGRNRAEMERMRRELELEQRRGLASAREELRRGMSDRDRDVHRRYDALLREYQDNVRADAARVKLEADAKYRELESAALRAEREWRERMDGVEEDARRYRSSAATRDRAAAEDAARSIEAAAEIYAEVDATPHGMFFPNRMNVFWDALRDAVDLRARGLHEAAAAISISTRSGVERLGYDVRDKHEEWLGLFSLLKARVGSLHLRLEAELAAWARLASPGETRGSRELSRDERRVRLAEIDYWSKGVYSEARRRVDEFGTFIAGVMRAGPDAYLRAGEAIGPDDLRRRLEMTDETGDALDRLGDLCETRYNQSCIRKQWGDAIVDFLEGEINLLWLPDESGWREADAATASGGTFREYMSAVYPGGATTQDAREWLGLAFENMAGRKIFVYIVPEERGQEVRNVVLIYADGDAEFAREIYAHVLESLSLAEEDGVVDLVCDISRMTMSPDPARRSAGLSLEKHLTQR
jgi:hypothetical protein